MYDLAGWMYSAAIHKTRENSRRGGEGREGRSKRERERDEVSD